MVRKSAPTCHSNNIFTNGKQYITMRIRYLVTESILYGI